MGGTVASDFQNVVSARIGPDPLKLSCDGGEAGRIAPLAPEDGITVRGQRCVCLSGGLAGHDRPPDGRGGRGIAAAVRLRRTRGCPGNMGLAYGVDEDERLVFRERLVRRGAYSY